MSFGQCGTESRKPVVLFDRFSMILAGTYALGKQVLGVQEQGSLQYVQACQADSYSAK